MPRYFFHTSNGEDYIDHDGVDCTDLDGARMEALRATGDMMHDQSRRFWKGEVWLMQVRDEHGVTVCELSFSAR